MAGIKPKGKVKIKWSANFAYAVGLLASDGNLSNTGRHIILVSKDIEQLENFMRALSIKVHIGKVTSGLGKTTTRIQFGDILFYQFLLDIGLMPNKSKVLQEVKIPPKFFFDFLRGMFDGDGSFYSYYDPRWKSSFMFYSAFASASPGFIRWLRDIIRWRLGILGHITRSSKIGGGWYQLKYAKKDSLKLCRSMYYSKNSIYLARKRLKIKKVFAIVGESL